MTVTSRQQQQQQQLFDGSCRFTVTSRSQFRSCRFELLVTLLAFTDRSSLLSRYLATSDSFFSHHLPFVVLPHRRRRLTAVNVIPRRCVSDGAMTFFSGDDTEGEFVRL